MGNNANRNILEVVEIDGLINQIFGQHGHLTKLKPETAEQQYRVNEAQRAIADFQAKELLALRRVFE